MRNPCMFSIIELESENARLKAEVARLKQIVDRYTMNYSDYMCSHCGHMYDAQSPVQCPNCGRSDSDSRKRVM